MLGLSFAAVPLYDLFCRVTGFGGTTQNASDKEIPKIIVNQDYKMRFDTNINSTLDWKFYPEMNTLNLKPGEVHTVKFNVENPSNEISSGPRSGPTQAQILPNIREKTPRQKHKPRL